MPDIRIPAIMIALAAPLAFGRVPPNGLYGMRIRETLSSREVWYRANRFAGLALIVAMTAAVGIKYLAERWLVSQGRYGLIARLIWVDVALLIVACAASYWRVKRGWSVT